MILKKLGLSLLLICHFLVSLGQTDSLFTIPDQYVTCFQNTESNLPAALQKQLTEANFVVVGETHGVKESTELISKISQLKRFDHFVTEIDSFSMRRITNQMNGSEAPLEPMPGLFGMYSYKEDFELLKALSTSETQVHGIDMVHPVTIRLVLLTLLKSEQIEAKSKAKIQALIDQHNADLASGKGYFSGKTIKETNKLLKRLQGKGSSDDRRLIEYAIREAYPPDLMKGRASYTCQKMSELNSNSEFTQKNVLFKFGGSHTRKTTNSAGFRDLGWLVDSLHQQNSVRAFSLAIVPVSGRTGLLFEIGGETTKPFDFEFRYYNQLRKLFIGIDQNDKDLFVNVASFRNQLNPNITLSKDLAFILSNFDGIVFLKNVTPSGIY